MEVTKKLLVEMVITKMPFGQFEDTLICNLPLNYLEGLNSIGFPNGKLGILLQAVYDMKMEGTEYILEPFKVKSKIN
ncbi:MAG: DUF3820 family protein [Sphingobacteriaceae bacterium]|nr:DUF3820 family protein [Sphingobacteriaceae bacterium]